MWGLHGKNFLVYAVVELVEMVGLVTEIEKL